MIQEKAKLSAARFERLATRAFRSVLTRKALGSLLFSLCAAAVLLVKIPYGFETNDQFQYFLLPYRSIYTPFLTNDWFTWQTTHYHWSFGHFIRALYFLFGERGFPVAVFIAHIAVLSLLGYACLRAARALKLHWVSAAIAVLTVAFVRRMGIAGAVVNHGVLLPSDAALVFFMLGAASWIEKKPLAAGIQLGLSGLVHANFAVIGPLALAAPELVRLVREKTVAPSLKLAGGFVLFAWPSLLAAGLGFFSADAAPDAIRILFKYRSPHHYNPPLFKTLDIFWPIVLMCVSFPVWLSRPKAGAGRANAVMLSLLGVQILAAVATVWADNVTIVRLFLWRLSIPLILFSAAAFGETLVTAFRSKKLFDIVFALSAAALVFAFSTGGQAILSPRVSLKGAGLLIPFAACSVLSPLIAARGFSFARHLAVGIAALPLVFALLAFDGGPLVKKGTGIVWSRAADNLHKFDFPSKKRISASRKGPAILRWISKHAPDDAVFLTPPGMNGFRLQAARAMFVDWKCCPMKGEEIAEWARRMNAVMGTKKLPAAGYALHRVSNRRYFSRSLHALAALAEREGLTHILARPSKKVPSSLKKLVTKGPYSVYQVR